MSSVARDVGGVPTATSLLLVVPGDADSALPDGVLPDGVLSDDVRQPRPITAEGWTAWAVSLHDALVARATPPTAADVAHVVSWLQVQAIGSRELAVVEPRCELFAPLWAAAALGAGMEVSIAHRAGGQWTTAAVVLADLPTTDDATWRPPGRGYAARVWVADRAEGMARRAVRLVQR